MCLLRFRLINLSCLSYMNVSIDDHTFSVIEADGVEIVELQNIDSLLIFPGQRYSIVVNTNQPVGNYCKSLLSERKSIRRLGIGV